MKEFLEFKDKFKIDIYSIYESEHWVWSLRPHQPTLGSGVLSLKRPAESMAAVTHDEYKNLHDIISVIENSLFDLFSYSKMNYLVLMMFDGFVHFHVIPRYESPVHFSDKEWHDKTWPAIPPLIGEELDEHELQLIKTHIMKRVKNG